MTTSLESSMATFHFAAVASATGFLINKLDVSNNNSSDKKRQNELCMLVIFDIIQALPL